MNSHWTRLVALSLVLAVVCAPAFAQEAPDGSTPAQVEDPPGDQGQAPDLQPAPADDPGVAQSQTSPASTEPAAVVAQWGSAPSIGPQADRAVAERWFRAQNAQRGRWGVPTSARDPYLDWQAENLLRSRLGQPALLQPPGVDRPAAAAQSPQSDQAVLSQPEFWTVSDDLWLAWLDGIEGQAPAGWADERPGEEWFTRENYLLLFKLKQAPRFDRYRLFGVAGRVNTTNTLPTDLLSGHKGQLEQIVPGAVAAYEPVVYPDNVIAVIGYDPWIDPDGRIRP